MSKLPPWLIKKIPKQQNIKKIQDLLAGNPLCTVCESARCPNIGECFSNHTLTFMILGDTCTRTCKFCAVKKANQLNSTLQPPDALEPQRIVDAAKKLNLKYVVITSVTRDDLPDGGAAHFSQCIMTIKQQIPEALVEVLVPDFQGDMEALKTVLKAEPAVLNHNVETIPRLYSEIRPGADFSQSINLLRQAKNAAGILTKSGFMVGLGESRDEILLLLKELRSAAVDIITIGQYLAPSPTHAPVVEYLPPEIFEFYRLAGLAMGFLEVAAGPLVRSSYHAHATFAKTISTC